MISDLKFNFDSIFYPERYLNVNLNLVSEVKVQRKAVYCIIIKYHF